MPHTSASCPRSYAVPTGSDLVFAVVRIGHAPPIRIPVHPPGTRLDPPRADAALRSGPGPGEWSVPAHLAFRASEWPAEDPQGHPDDARPRTGDDRDEPDGPTRGVLHRDRPRR